MSGLGFHLGIVVQNNDPEKRGRVKIFVPEHSPPIQALTDIMKEGVTLAFKSIDSNYSPEIASIIQDIKNALPWAEQAGPIFGGISSGRYNARLNKTTTSDSNAWKNGDRVEGYRPTNQWLDEDGVSDDFDRYNLYSHEYKPSNYSGIARGTFSIPNVGAHVYIFYLNNDVLHPVYFAASYGSSDFKRIYTMDENSDNDSTADYPNSYENRPDVDDATSKIFRSKHVINTNKNTIEMTDTDESEMIKITQYSGSFKEFNNRATIELATGQDQKLVIGDQFLTVRGNRYQSVRGDEQIEHHGNVVETYGDQDPNVVNEILGYHKQLAEYKQLFDVRRCDNKHEPWSVSPLQILDGEFIECPLCCGPLYEPSETYDYSPMIITDTICHMPCCYLHPIICAWLCPPIQMSGGGDTSPKSIPEFNDVIELEPRAGGCAGIFTNTIWMKGTRGCGMFGGVPCPCCNNSAWRSTPWGDLSVPGFSPSTYMGKWSPESRLDVMGEFDQRQKSLAASITEAELKLGSGGDKIENISMSKVETIGLAFNDLPSIRVDPIGKLRLDGLYVTPEVCVPYYLPSPHVEYVDVTDIPGGDYNLTIGNKWRVNVGSKGVAIQTTGPFDTYGSIYNITAEQLNIASKNEIVINGNERIELRARKITIYPEQKNALTIDGQLHCTRNMIIKGGAYIDGEVALNHITAPIQWYRTTTGEWYPEPTCVISALLQCAYFTIPVMLTVPHHTHDYTNIPLSLLGDSNKVRNAIYSRGINNRADGLEGIATISPANVTCFSQRGESITCK